MSAETLPNVGDIITSQKFAFGYYDNAEKRSITVDGRTREYSVSSYLSADERVEIAAQTGTIPPKMRTVELGAYDPNRANAKFVVAEANLQGGGNGSRPTESYRNGWHVRARRLNADGSYDQQGEVIRFYTTGDFTCVIELEDLQIVGKMQRQFA